MIYLDYNASTPIDPAVREAMLPYLGEVHGNPTSGHILGQQVRAGVERAREQVANLIGAKPGEIIFTSGGTEANNMVIKGTADRLADRGRHVITSAIEHPAVINPCKYLERRGFDVTFVGVDSTGQVDSEEVISAIRSGTILISIMLANNEVGTLQPVKQIAHAARAKGVLVHTDAAQACGKLPVTVDDLGVDFLSVAGHKVYAPQGVGALYMRSGTELEPLLHGAGHEGGRRAGTEAVPAIIGLGVAAEVAMRDSGSSHDQQMRDRLENGLKSALGDDVVVMGHPIERLPNTLAIGFRGCIGSEILAACPQICASTGAACHCGGSQRSAVLTAMNIPEAIAFGGVRLSVGRFTTEAEVDSAIGMLSAAAKKMSVKSVG